MLVDYHNHTSYCNHALGPMSQYLAEAEKLGLDEFGFSEHCPWMLATDDHPLCPNSQGWNQYCREVEILQDQLKARKSPMKLRFGVELDYTPGIEAKAAAFLSNHAFDYVIGSIHFVTNGRKIDGTPALARARTIRHLFELYLEAVERMAETGLIDIVGHLDLPKRDGDVPPGGYLDLIEELSTTLVRKKVVVEINTSGRDKPIREFFPSREAVRILARAGVGFTLGSDSHSPSDVGRYLEEAVAMLRDCGVREIVTFSRRSRIVHPL